MMSAARLHRSREARGALVGMVLAVPAGLRAQRAVVGVVRDSTTGRALAAATVQLVPQGTGDTRLLSVDTDSAGHFRFAAVPAGHYLLGFLHERLDSLGVEPPTRTLDVDAAPGDLRADLAVPSARAILAAICGARRDSTGVFIGRVLDADRGGSVTTGSIVVRWGEVRIDATGFHHTTPTVRVPVGDGGRYAACGVPLDVTVLVHADEEAGARRVGESGEIEMRVGSTVPLVYRDLLVASDLATASTGTPPAQSPADGASTADSSAPNATAASNAAHGDTAARPARPTGASAATRRGTSRLTGRVRRPDGSALAGARVVVRGAGAADSAAVTGPDGTFHLDALPGGTYPVEAIAIGFTPVRGAVDLRPDRPASIELAVGARVSALQSVNVYANYGRARTEFEARARTGWARIVRADAIERFGARTIGDALQTTPGLHVTGTSIVGRTQIRGRGGCTPEVYFDGFRVDSGATNIDEVVAPQDVAAIEVYADAMTAPAQYGRGSCASILIWSKGALR